MLPVYKGFKLILTLSFCVQYEAIKAEAAEAAQQASAGQQPFSELVRTGCITHSALWSAWPALASYCVLSTT